MGACWVCCRRANGHVKLSMTATSGRDDSYQPYQGEELGRTSDQPSTSKNNSDMTMKLLLGSKNLRRKRIPYENLTLEGPSLSEEVSVYEYNGQKVAARKLPQSEQDAKRIEAFAEEIELNASLVHPNIVQFIGVAWRDLSDLALVREFLPKGSLRAYLQANMEQSWTEEKTRIALGIAQALEYLHGCRPTVIHGDIKANSVLLTEDLEPKLIEIGSRGTTTGGKMSFWTAPEVLEGKQLTQQADIYSFGVLLTELDTGKGPYSDTMTKTGIKLQPSQVLQLVKTGKLRPHLSKNCPLRIQRLGAACLAHNPLNRPSARQLVRQLESRD
ncbi:putative serine/threonine-protein kinase drkB [Phytophthora citrophthora]|uniref:Serine/threonine-protein kinase drkB n=1 Tax=Phytophthora citrophthora TaxID=4793 RepID=A0AAD9LQT7_9STRA|nr:putative serine/threonine-protein kinase drkB [Phytophthora citrophthora]